jgi:hypothetical protein
MSDKVFKYEVLMDVALDTYAEHGMQVTFDTKLFNGLLIINAPDEDTADKIRMTYTDIRMWKKISD